MQLRPGIAQEAGMSAERITHLKELAANWVREGLTSALVVLVARRGIIVLHEAFGRLTPEPEAPTLPLDAVFPMASLTKPITATAAMMLVEEGQLGLNRPVAEYIPEFAGEGKASVLIHHLLTHTSGLKGSDVEAHVDKRSREGVEIPLLPERQHPKIHEYLCLGYDAPLFKPPGVEMAYADFNYELLGEIVRRVSGKPLADFATERIFAPLGMQDSWYRVPDSASHRIVKRPATALWAEAESPILAEAPSYIKSLFGGLNSPTYQDLPFGSDGVFSTAMDMASFGQMFLNRGRYGERQLLSPATVAAMTSNQIPGIGAFWGDQYFPEASWGYGWDVPGDKKDRNRPALWSPGTFDHGGMGGVILWVDPLYELVGVYFSVRLRMTADSAKAETPYDLFVDAVTAAVVEL